MELINKNNWIKTKGNETVRHFNKQSHHMEEGLLAP